VKLLRSEVWLRQVIMANLTSLGFKNQTSLLQGEYFTNPVWGLLHLNKIIIGVSLIAHADFCYHSSDK
jgi:hypothetical protein